LTSAPSHAAIRTVKTKADSGADSLRAVLAAADPNDTINFSVTGTILLTSGELTINKSLVINGPGAGKLSVERSAATGVPMFRILKIESGNVRINGLTISQGRARTAAKASGGGIYVAAPVSLLLNRCHVVNNISYGDGGGIYNAGKIRINKSVIKANRAGLVGTDLGVRGGGLSNGPQAAILTDCAISNNSTAEVGDRSDVGGGIYTEGPTNLKRCIIAGNRASSGGGIRRHDAPFTMVDSTVSSNVARDGQGGGLYFYADPNGSTPRRGTLERCTFSGNIAGTTGTARSGGAIYNLDVLWLINCTIAKNTARGNGGGIRNFGILRVANCTIAGNVCVTGDGGGIANTISATVRNTIIALNQAPNTPDIVGAFSSTGYNLIGDRSGSTSFDDGVNHDLVGTASNPLDPRLGPLQNNGGPTSTRALLAGSPAINKGLRALEIPIDQRLYVRAGSSDIGAYEFGAVPAVFKPDMQIRDDSGISFVGDNVYNNTGAGQIEGQNSNATTPAEYIVKLQNDGNCRDIFTVRGTGGDSNSTVTYTDVATGANITAQVTGAGWSRTLAAGDTRLIRLTVKSSQSVPSGTKTVLVTATSTGNATKKDTVKAVTTFGLTASMDSA